MGSGLPVVVLLLGSGKGEIDLSERWVKNLTRELLQVVVEGVGVEEFKDWSHEEGEGRAKWEAKVVR